MSRPLSRLDVCSTGFNLGLISRLDADLSAWPLSLMPRRLRRGFFTQWKIETTDRNRISWSLQGTGKQQVLVKENESVKLDLIPSPVATVVVNKLPGMRPELTTRIKTATGGEIYHLTGNGKNFIVPIKILDATGKTVLRLQFPHNKGPGFPFWYWEPAQGMKGKFKAIPDVAALPFKVKVQPSEEFQIGREEKRPTAK